jgi:hypothetical protein
LKRKIPKALKVVLIPIFTFWFLLGWMMMWVGTKVTKDGDLP